METEKSKKNAPIILIVDDISVNVTILENMLEHEGYGTMSALSVQEALELMKETKPSLILSDLSMPEIDGLEFCRMLKSDQSTRDIPFIFITVLNTSKEKEEAFTAGAVDFIPKPFDNVEVLMRVNNHLGSYRLRQEMADYNRMMHKLVKDQKKQIEAEHTNVLQALSGLVRRKDPEKAVHQDNVGYNCKLLAQGLQFLPEYEDVVTDEFVEAIGIAARLRDIGRFVVSLDPKGQESETDGTDQDYIRKYAEEGRGCTKEVGREMKAAGIYRTRMN
ncbi:MAG: response regulator [Lachnospiraceae bacterium]|nr:response regulator [Lachnospiraceae bacterium]